ncbi:MAG TPA: carboxypeptidase-like regulatory domain-containing protein, partial [Verrucomicrobiae bacterium]
GRLDWSLVKVPKILRVKDERVSAAGINPEAGAVLIADVYDMATWKPVAGAKLLVSMMTESAPNQNLGYKLLSQTSADNSGHAQVEKLSPGRYRFAIAADGYATRAIGYEQFNGAALRKYTIYLSRVSDIHGRVEDADGKPISGAKIRTSGIMGIDGRGYELPERPEVKTDADGEFTISGLPTGYGQLWASATGYYFGDIFTIHDLPAKDVVLKMTRAGKIKVTATDNSGTPINKLGKAELMVNVEPKEGSKIGSWGGSATIHPDGTYEFTDVPPGEYRLNVRPNPYSEKQPSPEKLITLAPGVSTNVTLRFH